MGPINKPNIALVEASEAPNQVRFGVTTSSMCFGRSCKEHTSRFQLSISAWTEGSGGRGPYIKGQTGDVKIFHPCLGYLGISSGGYQGSVSIVWWVGFFWREGEGEDGVGLLQARLRQGGEKIQWSNQIDGNLLFCRTYGISLAELLQSVELLLCAAGLIIPAE